MPGAIKRNWCPARVAVRCVINLDPGDGATGAKANLMYGDGVLLRKYIQYTVRDNPVGRNVDQLSALLCWTQPNNI